MTSSNVELLFTNIIRNQTYALKMFFGNKKYSHDISKDSFRGLLTLAMKESFALFNNEHYKQLDGVSTGYPLKAMFANIFLRLHEIIWLNIL